MWQIIDSEKDYQDALKRFEEIKYAEKGTILHREKLSLIKLISNYETARFPITPLDPIELAKIRKNEFGYPPSIRARKSTLDKKDYHK